MNEFHWFSLVAATAVSLALAIFSTPGAIDRFRASMAAGEAIPICYGPTAEF